MSHDFFLKECEFQRAAGPCPTRPVIEFKLAVYYSRRIRNEFQKPGTPALGQKASTPRPLPDPRPPTPLAAPGKRDPRSLRGAWSPRHPPRGAPRPPPANRAPPPRRRPRPRRAPPRPSARPRPRRAPPRPRPPGARAALREGQLGARSSQRAPRGDGGGGAFQKFPRP